MPLKKILLKKILTLIIVTALLSQSISGMYLFAQEAAISPAETPETTPVQIESTPTETQQNTSETTPALTDNQEPTTTPIPANLADPSPTPFDNTNNTIIDNSNSSDTQTGGNTTASPTGADLNTGNATSGSENQNAANVSDQTPTQPTTNNTTATTTTHSTSQTGGNTATATDGHATIVTGDAVAYANLVNLINAHLVDSRIRVFFINLDSGSQDLDLNKLWKELVAQSQAKGLSIDGNQTFYYLAEIQNLAKLTNNVTVESNTGGNSASGNTAVVQTGNATSIANVINILNATLAQSNYVFGVINIGNFSGNIILPRPEYFIQPQGGNTNESASSSIAMASTTMISTADSGNNSLTTTNGHLQSGNATALSTEYTLANITATDLHHLMLQFNNASGNGQQIENWSHPGSSDYVNLAQFVLEKASLQGAASNANGGDNNAQLSNELLLRAMTGNNSAEGIEALLKSGDAKTIANVYNLLNLNLIRNNWFYGLFNIYGNWNGKIIFAYPDVFVSTTANKPEFKDGEVIELTVNYKNQGYDDAPNSKISVHLPKGLEYVSDNSNLSKSSNLVFEIGTIKQGQGNNFVIRAKVNLDDTQETTNRLVKLIHAAEQEEDYRNLIVETKISTSDPEIDTHNSGFVTELKVWFSDDNQATGSEQTESWPVLSLIAKNNVGAFVYPQDIVTYEMEVRNLSNYPAYNSYLLHSIYDSQKKLVASTKIPLGSIGAGKYGKISFGLPTQNNSAKIKSGQYTTISQIVGFTYLNDEVVSNEAVTGYQVKVLTTIKQAALASSEPSVKGTFTSFQPPVNLFPYLMAMLLSGAYIILSGLRNRGKLPELGNALIIMVMFLAFLASFHQIIDLSQHQSYTVKMTGPSLVLKNIVDSKF